MLDAVFIAGHDAATDLAIENVLALVVGLTRVGVEPLDQALADAGFLAKPDGRADQENIGGLNLLPDIRPIILVGAVFGHVGEHARGDIVIDQANSFARYAIPRKNGFGNTE